MSENQNQEDRELRTLVSCLSLDEKAALLAGVDARFTAEMPSVGLRRMTWSDGPVGVSMRSGSDDFPLLTPSPVSLAATWDRELVRRVGEVVGDDAVQRHVQVIHAPNVNLPRSPLGGRAFEQFSEDPWLTGELASSWMQGVQSRKVACAVKHFICNDSETERQTMNSVVTESVLREVYAMPFHMAVSAGAWGIMSAYNRVNGTYCSEQEDLIRHVIKGEWGFDGFVMSDFHAAHNTVPSIHAGLDVEMPGPPVHYGERLATAVRQGEVDEELLDQAVIRFLRLARRVGSLGESNSEAPAPHTDPCSVLREAAAASFVLLSNKCRALPVAPGSDLRVAVIGPQAAAPTYQGAAFGQVGQRQDLETSLGAIQREYGEAGTVIHEPGLHPTYRVPPLRLVRIVTARDSSVPGMNVDYYVAENSSTPAVEEVRTAGNLIWNLRMPGMGRIERGGRVHVSAIIHPQESGVHTFSTGSSSEFELQIDGKTALSQGPQPPTEDTAVAIRPPILTTTCTLEAGVPVAIELDMPFGPARTHSLHFGCLPPVPDDLMERAVNAARQADVVFLVVGETQDTSVESADRTTTRLPGGQDELIDRICEANRNTVVIVNASHPVDMPWVDKPAALLHVWFPGQEFAGALADVLTGRKEPGGRLPVTFADQEKDYPVFDLTPANHDLVYETTPTIGYRHFDARGLRPRFPFGHGLSYATFVLEDFNVAKEGELVELEVNVRNTSERPGKAVVQVYVRQATPSDVQRYVQLKGFSSLSLEAGQMSTASVVLNRSAFSRWSSERRTWEVIGGSHEILVGLSSTEILFRTEIKM
jgi:beta-glucosidase